MKNRKWILLLSLMLALSLALFGCGNDDDDEKTDSDDQQQTQQDDTQDQDEDQDTADDGPYGQYKKVCKQMQALDSVSYTAKLETEIEYGDDDEQESDSRARVQEVYKGDTMDMAYRSSYNTFGTKGKLNIYYKDKTIYYDNNGTKSKRKGKLKKLLNSTMRYSNPYVYLKGSSIFNIDENDLKSVNVETGDDGTDIELVLKDTCIDKYFVLDLDEESSLYGSGFTPKNYEIEITLNNNGDVTGIDMHYDMELSPGKGEVSWDCDITGINDISQVDYPDYVD